MNTAACDLPRKSLMRSDVIWTMLASVVMLIGIGLMHFSLTALQEPWPCRDARCECCQALLYSPGEPPRNSSARPVVDGVFWYRMGLL